MDLIILLLSVAIMALATVSVSIPLQHRMYKLMSKIDKEEGENVAS